MKPITPVIRKQIAKIVGDNLSLTQMAFYVCNELDGNFDVYSDKNEYITSVPKEYAGIFKNRMYEDLKMRGLV